MPETIKQVVKPAGITPTMPSTPPPEVLAKNFTIDDKMFSSDSGAKVSIENEKTGEVTPAKVTPEESKIVELPKQQEVKTEPKTEPKPEVKSFLKPPTEKKEVKTEKREEVVKTITPPSKEKVQRDYSGFNETEIAHFKQMSDPAYKFVSDLIKEKKELEKNKDTSFLQHPEAYTLSQEYRQTQVQASFAKREGDYWQQCLSKIKRGEPFQPIIGWNPQDGSPQFGTEIQPTEEIEEQVRASMNKCYSVLDQTQQKLQTIPQGFKQRVQQDLQAINMERAKRFAWVQDPKLMEYTMEVEGLGERSIKQIREDIISLFPPYYRNQPGTEVAADLMVALRIQDAELKQARESSQLAETKKAEIQRAEPGSNIKPMSKGVPINGVSEFTLDGLPRS